MPDEIKPDPTQAVTQEAELAAENIASGVEETPSIDTEADYEAAQQFSVSEVDRTGAGAEAAEEATAPEFELTQPQETKTVAQDTSDSADYDEMAKDLASDTGGEPVSNVSDDLIEQALDMGKPGKSD